MRDTASRPGGTQDALDRILVLKSEGLGLQAIADTLTEESVATPRGGRWWPASVSRRLAKAAAEGDARAMAALQKHANRRLLRYGGPRSTPKHVRDEIIRLSLNEHLPQHKIADVLAEQGVPCTRGGRRWHQSTVRSVLIANGIAGEPQP